MILTVVKDQRLPIVVLVTTRSSLKPNGRREKVPSLNRRVQEHCVAVMLPNCCVQLGIERRQLRSVRALGMQLKLRMLDSVSDGRLVHQFVCQHSSFPTESPGHLTP